MKSKAVKLPKVHTGKAPVPTTPPEGWVDEAVDSGRLLQEIWREQLRAMISDQIRQYRRVAKEVGLAFWQHKCPYCREELTIATCTLEHVTPQCAGGDDSFENLIPACEQCNRSRGDTPVDKFLDKIDKTGSKRAWFEEKFSEWIRAVEASRNAPISHKLERAKELGWLDEMDVQNKKDQQTQSLSDC